MTDQTKGAPVSGNRDESGSASNRLFDLRELIAGLFVLFGVMLVVAGVLDGRAEIDKAAGVRINLWAGIGMILVAAVFVVWRLWKPLRKDDLVEAGSGSEDSAAAPADPLAPPSR